MFSDREGESEISSQEICFSPIGQEVSGHGYEGLISTNANSVQMDILATQPIPRQAGAAAPPLAVQEQANLGSAHVDGARHQSLYQHLWDDAHGAVDYQPAGIGFTGEISQTDHCGGVADANPEESSRQQELCGTLQPQSLVTVPLASTQLPVGQQSLLLAGLPLQQRGYRVVQMVVPEQQQQQDVPIVGVPLVGASACAPNVEDVVDKSRGKKVTKFQPILPHPDPGSQQAPTTTLLLAAPTSATPILAPAILAPAVTSDKTEEDLNGSKEGQETISQMDAIDRASEGVDIDEIKDLVLSFKKKRIALGLTQTQVGVDFETLLGVGPYSQSQICRIENLDITPRQAKTLKPMLEKWLSTADDRYCYLSSGGTLVPVLFNRFVGTGSSASAQSSPFQGKKRQKRTTFTPEALEALNKEFAENATPNAYRMEQIGKELGIDYKTIRIWFCNKRQNTKNSSS